jgi:hypothetical protein
MPKFPHQPLPKVRATLYVSLDVLDEARNAAFHLAGFPARMTLTKLVEHALRAELMRLKEAYLDGHDFPPRSEDLKGGRPLAA